MPPVPFPLSSAPGQYPGEGQGRLVNCYATKSGDEVTWRRVPGLTLFSGNLTEREPRGFLAVGPTLYGAFKDKAVTVAGDGTVTALTGALPGSDVVTWARNNRAPTPDVTMVCASGAFIVSGGAIATYPDPDLPSVNSVAFMDGYFLWTTGGGRLYASDLNSTAVNALSFTSCEGAPDGLLRVIVSNGIAYAMGTATIEAYQNAGTSPFPLARVGVMSVGLKAGPCVAGFGEGWDGPPIFVAADNTVRAISGVDTRLISTPDVERAIASVAASDLRAFVYVHNGNPVWVIRSSAWCWEYNTRTGLWNERRSDGMTTWRGQASAYIFNRWLVGDTDQGFIHAVDPVRQDEWGKALAAEVESAPLKAFPGRSAVKSAMVDIVVGQGDPAFFAEPVAMISYSHDGGGAWSAPVHRKIGPVGRFDKLPRVNRLGLTGAQGLRLKVRVSDPVPFVFKGASVEGEGRGAP